MKARKPKTDPHPRLYARYMRDITWLDANRPEGIERRWQRVFNRYCATYVKLASTRARTLDGVLAQLRAAEHEGRLNTAGEGRDAAPLDAADLKAVCNATRTLEQLAKKGGAS